MAALQAIELLHAANLSTDKVIVIADILNSASREGGTCVRIKFQPIPYGISIICTGFVLIWLLFLPFGLFRGVVVDPEYIAIEIAVQYSVMIIAFLFFALLLLACDEISNQLEDPFYQLPLEEIVEGSSTQNKRTMEYLRSLREARVQEAARLSKESGNKQGIGGMKDKGVIGGRTVWWEGPPPPPKF